MMKFLRSRSPVARATRIGVATLGGWLLISSPGWAQVPTWAEWPDTNFEKRTVDLGEISSGGPPKDGIPAIDEPKFLSAQAAIKAFAPREPVVSLALGGEAKAYPLSILIWHEIVNDSVGSQPVAVTFCPLCNATLVFDRRVGDRVLDFGTTGRLRMSDLVMYDRQTESWWQQFTGVGIVGELAGTELVQIPASIVALEDFVAAYPRGQVLSTDTGHTRAYGQNPYRGYDDIASSPFLFRDPVDPRLPAMERVLNISLGGRHRLYPFSMLEKTPVLNDTIAQTPVVVLSKRGTLSVLDAASIASSRTIPSATAFSRTLNGQVLTFAQRDGHVIDEQTASSWNILGQATSGPLTGNQLGPVPSGVHFAFAWLAFRPDSEIFTR